MKRILIVFVSAVLLLACAAYAWGGDTADTYNDALLKMAKRDYAGAIADFEKAGDYEDASRLITYCRARAAADSGQYAIAAVGMAALGDFRDAPQMALYYTALNYESTLQYEEAGEILAGLALFMDSADRLLTYPQKINARDYAIADSNEQAGKLETALSQFKALGSYLDSAARADAVLEKINARDYAAADKAEQTGDYAAALEGFTALGDYKDSKARAKAVEEKGTYARALAAANEGNFSLAYRLFTKLGSYSDSELKAYITSVAEFADVKSIGDGIAAFCFHNTWGIINLRENIIISPMWDSIGYVNEYGLAKVSLNYKYGYIDTQGYVVVECKWDDISAYRDGLVTVYNANNRAYGLCDTQGKEIGTVSWKSIDDFSEGLALVRDAKNLYGFIDKNGNAVINPQYTDALSFSQGLAAVQTNGKWQYIDQANNVVIEPLYTKALSFSGGTADVYRDGIGWQIIDQSGNLVYFIDTHLEADYLSAKQVMQDGKWKEAAEAFGALDAYKDSDMLCMQCYYNYGAELLAAGNYDAATRAFTDAGKYSDAETQALAAQYAEGKALLAAGDYDGATKAFKDAGKYSDAATQALAAQYAEGEELLAAGKYDKAIQAFTEAGKYSDAATQITECLYQKAGSLNAAGRYEEAYAIYNNIRGYKDVDSIIENDDNIAAAAADALKAKWEAGKTVTFGAYEQDNNTGNGKEPIEWLVLESDGETALLISKYALDAKPYNTSYTSVTWETCTLRKWLNSDFYNAAFSAEEKRQIVESNVSADKNPSYSTSPGKATKDNVYLLSITEVNKYFKNDSARMCAPTDYAVKNGAYTNSKNKVDNRACGWWWLRSPGRDCNHAADVLSDGYVDDYGNIVDYSDYVVRPVVRVRLF